MVEIEDDAQRERVWIRHEGGGRFVPCAGLAPGVPVEWAEVEVDAERGVLLLRYREGVRLAVR